MKLLLDQGLPRSTVSQLSKTGIEAVHVGEIGMAAAGDAEIPCLCGATFPRNRDTRR